MTLTVKWFGHSAFQLVYNGTVILIDPFLSNPLSPLPPGELTQADCIIVTHGHADHISDVPAIAQQTGAPVVANFEVANWLSGQGVEQTIGHNPGGGAAYDFGRVEFTPALHSSSLPDGSYGGVACGVILFFPEMAVYHAGDTALFSDMQLLGDKGLGLAIVPIGDYFTMGPDDSVRALQYLKPQYAMPMHYNTFPPIEQDASAWANKVTSQTKANPIVLDPGGEHTF
ncbi:MAG: metal-dependent hydrolase [Anaerolineales bacterium]